jgi:hypothetical protein
MKLEATKGSTRSARARQAFVRAVQQHLPHAAFDELERFNESRDPDSDDLVGWASRWHVHAPCVLEAAPGWCLGFRTDSEAIPRPPDAWIDYLKNIRSLAVSTSEYVEVQSVISLEQEQSDRQRLAADRIRAQREGNPTSEPNERMIEDDLRRVREAATKQMFEHALRPIAADPLIESFADFQRRTHAHWEAMVKEAKRLGCVNEIRERDELTRDVDFVIRFQIKEQTYRTIATELGITEDAVRKAIVQFAKLITLTLRRLASGRPRTTQRRRRKSGK